MKHIIETLAASTQSAINAIHRHCVVGSAFCQLPFDFAVASSCRQSGRNDDDTVSDVLVLHRMEGP
jgi:hypothetical protein